MTAVKAHEFAPGPEPAPAGCRWCGRAAWDGLHAEEIRGRIVMALGSFGGALGQVMAAPSAR